MPTTATTILGTYARATDRLTAVPLPQRHQFQDLPRNEAAHMQAHASIAAFREVEVGGAAAAPMGPEPVRIAAWNLERCLYPRLSAGLLQQHGATLALLTELDHGMLRTGQRHTAADIASKLGARYAYGLEFLELMPMPPPGSPMTDEDNDAGFHGNAIITPLPFENPVVIRLEEAADWFIAPKGGQRRIGNRMAVAVTITTEALRFVACTVHLESATDGLNRATQFRTLLNSLDIYAKGLPILIGGDLNTQVGPGRSDDPAEPLFAIAREHGCDWDACNLARPTTRTSTWSAHEGDRQLDWFCARSLKTSDPRVIPAVGSDGTVLSDHEMIMVTISA